MGKDAVEQSSVAREQYLSRTFDIQGYFELCEEAQKAYPRNMAVALQYATALGYVGQTKRKVRALKKILEVKPEFRDAQITLGIELMSQGKFREGWPHYDYRKGDRKTMSDEPQLDPARAWTGDPLTGKTILVVNEQGLGDTLMFSRYAIHLQRIAARPVLRVQNAVGPLLAQSPAVGHVLQPGESAESHCWVRMLDLVPAITPTIDKVTWPGAYVSPPASRAPVPDLGGTGLKVGVAWAGNTAFLKNHFRSMPLHELAPLREAANCRFFSLQMPPVSDEISRSGYHDWLTDLSGVTQPFIELARVVSQLDVVVTVCTSMAHLAGAMGKPTFLMLSELAEWRWGPEGTETPWYPSMHLFRQKRFGDWRPVVEDVATALRKL